MSKIGGYFKDYNDESYQALNREINGLLGDLPYFYQIPPELFSEEIPSAEKAPYFDFRHALSKSSEENALGLRLYLFPPEASSRTVCEHLVQSGLVKTGDIILSFRQGTTGTGEYQHLQLGLTHTGIALIRNGVLFNLDSPLNYSGMLDHKHYTEDQLMLHILRPNLNNTERQNLQRWAELAYDNREVLGSKLSFCSDYGAPKSARRHEKEVFNLGRLIVSGGKKGNNTSMYCSEFVWHLLALRKCNIEDASIRQRFIQGDAGSIAGNLTPLFASMPVLGTALLEPDTGTPGLSDGVGLILNSLEVTPQQVTGLLEQAFNRWDPHFSGGRPPYSISSGHQEQAKKFEPLYQPLKDYFASVKPNPSVAAQIKSGIDQKTQGQENYSPTAFLVQALLPMTSRQRVLTYIGTLSFPTTNQQSLIEQKFPQQLSRMLSMRPATLGGAPEILAVEYKDGFRGDRFFKQGQVRMLQCMLNHLGFSAGNPDGLYGNGTTDAVRACLAANNQPGDGRSLTWSQWEGLEAQAGDHCRQYWETRTRDKPE